MAIKDIIGAGIGFAPGKPEFIVTRGFTSGAVVIPQIWTPVTAASGTWSATSVASGTWTPTTPAPGIWTPV